jgi:hypothetical protein
VTPQLCHLCGRVVGHTAPPKQLGKRDRLMLAVIELALEEYGRHKDEPCPLREGELQGEP